MMQMAKSQVPSHQKLCYTIQMKPADRLRQARKAAGHRHATDAAEALGVNKVTYISHENGNRGIGPKAAQKYATAYRISTDWLLYGTGQTQEGTGSSGISNTSELVHSLLSNSDRPASSKLDRELFQRSLNEALRLERSLLGGYGSIEDLMTMTETIYKVALKRKKETPTE